MTSSRIILLFLGIIFLMIIVLSGNRLFTRVKDRISSVFRKPTSVTATVVPNPTGAISITPSVSLPVSSPSKTFAYKEIPSTGPAETAWAFLLGMLIVGIGLRSVNAREHLK